MTAPTRLALPVIKMALVLGDEVDSVELGSSMLYLPSILYCCIAPFYPT